MRDRSQHSELWFKYSWYELTLWNLVFKNSIVDTEHVRSFLTCESSFDMVNPFRPVEDFISKPHTLHHIRLWETQQLWAGGKWMLEHLEATGKSNATTVHKHESITTIRGTGWKAKFTVQMTILKCSHTFKSGKHMRLGVFFLFFF